MMEQTTAYKALERFKTTGVHYAMVADEYGIFQGIITLNDMEVCWLNDGARKTHKDTGQISR
jgi:putative hemolysin